MRWFSRASTAELASLQQRTPLGISPTLRTCIGAWRLYDAIEAWFAGEPAKLRDMKLDTSKWYSKEQVLVHANRRLQYHIDDPFTRCFIAAYKQLEDRDTLLNGGDDSAVRTRHQKYKETQNVEVVA